MKATRTGTLSGCIIWVITFGLINMCFFPAAMFIGGFTSASNFAMRTLGPHICPSGTTAESYSYDTTTTDEYGNSQPSTAYELHCVDTNGNVIKNDPILYAFLWDGIIAIIGFVLAGILALIFAAPAGVAIARLFKNRQRMNISTNIEPE